MPIKDKSKYPANWAEISKAQRERAGNKCELCGAVNHQPHPLTGSMVVLTVHHIEWLLNPLLNHSYPNLIVVCQRCHNRLDLGKRKRNAAATRAKQREERDVSPNTCGTCETYRVEAKVALGIIQCSYTERYVSRNTNCEGCPFFEPRKEGE